MTKNTNVVMLDDANEGDDDFDEFLETLREGNDSVVFLISKSDGTMAIGSTAKSAKDLLWDYERLKSWMRSLIDRGLDD